MRHCRFAITGMHCVVCQGHVCKAVEAIAGASSIQVDLLGNALTLDLEESVSTQLVIDAVKAAGYGAELLEEGGEVIEGSSGEPDEIPSLCRRFLASLIFAIPLCYLAMGGMLGLPIPAILATPRISALLQLLLVLPILWWNRSFFVNGTRALLSRSPSMDTLVALAAGVGFLYNLWCLCRLFAGKTVMVTFETPAMLLTLITLGKWLEGRAKQKTTSELRNLKKLVPQQAIVRREDAEMEIPIRLLRVGDICLVRPGGTIPADGVVTTGHSSVNQSAITGEWMPVEKNPGDEVIGATINQSGYLEFRVTAVGAESLFGRIVSMVSEAGASKAPIARLADRVCAVFVPAVLGIAIVTLACWLALGANFSTAIAHAIAVLAISCPCALGLATPVAIMAGTGVGAKLGILFKNASVMESLSHVDIVAFDKTGTITAGHPVLVECIPASGYDKEGVLLLAASLENASEHPLGTAIVSAANDADLELVPVMNFSSIPGQGISGKLNGRAYACGNHRMLEAREIEVPSGAEQGAATTLYLIGPNNAILAEFRLEDKARPEASGVLSALRSLEISSVMLTGDQQTVGEELANRLGIPEVHGGLLPQDKAEWISNARSKGAKIAMVGDGINDAPALASADVGIAIGEGTAVAVDTADVVLAKDGLVPVLDAMRLSRAVLTNIRQNLAWAFGYNILAIPLATGLFSHWGISIPAWGGAAAMAASSIIVCTNALRLQKFSGCQMTGSHG